MIGAEICHLLRTTSRVRLKSIRLQRWRWCLKRLESEVQTAAALGRIVEVQDAGSMGDCLADSPPSKDGLRQDAAGCRSVALASLLGQSALTRNLQAHLQAQSPWMDPDARRLGSHSHQSLNRDMKVQRHDEKLFE